MSLAGRATPCRPQDYYKGMKFILNKFSGTRNFISFVSEISNDDSIKRKYNKMD